MGLDIGVYNNLQSVATSLHPDSDEYYHEGFLHIYINPDFPGRAEGIDPALTYKGDRVYSFRAGGYGGYNEWRDQLAAVAGYPQKEYDPGYGAKRLSHAAGAWAADSGPFWELINFSDCEGVIGPVVSAKLAKDFAEFESKAQTMLDTYSLERYQDWKKAFELASQNGLVRFS